jgi:hypothetical protein
MTTVQASSDALTAPHENLRAPTRRQLEVARKVGRDPNELLAAFQERYMAANREVARRINAMVGAGRSEEDWSNEDWRLYRELWDEVNRIAAERFHEWWVAPVQDCAKVLHPRVTVPELEGLAAQIRASRQVGFEIRRTPGGPLAHLPTIVQLRGTRSRGHRERHGARRAGGIRSGTDPGDDGPGEPEPPPLRLVPPPPPKPTRYTFGCLTAEERS